LEPSIAVTGPGFLRARRRLRGASFLPPSPGRHNRPDGFHQPKRPCSLKESVNRPQRARHGEQQDEPRAALLERVTHQHGRHREESKNCESVHENFLRLPSRRLKPPGPGQRASICPQSGHLQWNPDVEPSNGSESFSGMAPLGGEPCLPDAGILPSAGFPGAPSAVWTFGLSVYPVFDS